MEWFRKTASNWSTGKPTVVKTRNVSLVAGQTKISGGSLHPAMMIQRPEPPAAKLTIRRSPEGVTFS